MPPDGSPFRLDLGNAAQLSRALPELGRQGTEVVVELPSRDLDHSTTVVEDEAELVPILRHLQQRVPKGLRLRTILSSGRPYVMPPPALDISTQDRCGLRCPMCSSRKKAGTASLEAGQVLSLIDLAAAWGIGKVSLTGAGEPLAEPHLLQYLEHAVSRGLRPSITTSGAGMTMVMAAELAALPVSVSVSVHGNKKDTHDGITGVEGSAERAWQALRLLVSARDTLKAGLVKTRMTVSVSTVIQRGNVNEVAPLVERTLAEGCSSHNVQPVNLQHGVVRDGRIERRDDSSLMDVLWPEHRQAQDIDRMLVALLDIARRHPGYLSLSEQRMGLLQKYFEDSSRQSLGGRCGAGWRFLGVDERLRIRACYRVPWNLGTGAPGSRLQLLWNSHVYSEIRDLMKNCPLTCLNSCYFRT